MFQFKFENIDEAFEDLLM